jgi:trehalose 6-phosphate phosphatase
MRDLSPGTLRDDGCRAQRTMSRPAASIEDRQAPPPADLARMALFLDIDGTLVDFAPHPDAVVVDAGLPSLLRRLHSQLGGALAPLSGRPLREVDSLLGLVETAAAGGHGAELRDARDRMLVAPSTSAPIHRWGDRARQLLSAFSGVLVEEKPAGLALHYRNAPNAATAVKSAAHVLLREAGSDYALQEGNHVVELKPAGVDKGGAVARLMRCEPFAGRVPWMLGDDLTDEHAFACVNAQGGVSIIVGPRRPTAARYALDDPAAARHWLATLADAHPMQEGRR